MGAGCAAGGFAGPEAELGSGRSALGASGPRGCCGSAAQDAPPGDGVGAEAVGCGGGKLWGKDCRNVCFCICVHVGTGGVRGQVRDTLEGAGG